MYSETDELIRALAENAEGVCRAYLSAGRREGSYWIVGDLQNNPGRSNLAKWRVRSWLRELGARHPESQHSRSEAAETSPTYYTNILTQLVQANPFGPGHTPRTSLLNPWRATHNSGLFKVGQRRRIPVDGTMPDYRSYIVSSIKKFYWKFVVFILISDDD